MKQTKLLCLLVCFISVGYMALGEDTKITTDDHNALLRYVQDLKDHVTRLENRLNDQNNRILKQEDTIREQRKDFANRINRQEKEFLSRVIRQQERIQEQRKEFITRTNRQQKEFMGQITRQEETIRTLKKKCNLMPQWNGRSLHKMLANARADQEKLTPIADGDSSQVHDTVLQNGTRKRSDDTSIGALEPVLSQVTTKITEMTADIQALKNTNTRQDQERGTAYTRWGHTGCPDSSELVYTGIIGGTLYTDVGGAGNHLCLTSQPVFDGHTQPSGNGYTYIYGSEYEICPEAECQTTPACAVCRASRAACVMVPGTDTCSPGWTKEYSGYIMADHHTHTGSSEFICVDSSHKHGAYSSQANDNENLIYYTHTKCGALPCPPYENEKILTCVVCTK